MNLISMIGRISLAICLLGVLGMVTIQTADAQGSRRPVLDRIEAQRVAYITSELELTTQEAQVFWPVYNEYKAEEQAMKMSFRGKFNRSVTLRDLSAEDAQKYIDHMLEFEQKQLDLKVKYTKKFITVLPIQKVAMLPEAERGFREKMVRRISERGEWRRN